MENLIPIIGKLQDVFAAVGSRENKVQLPQIVVVGSQSAGKSSVIEGIVGKDFLPRGSGIVTRRPLLIHLIHTPKEAENRAFEDDWATFEHIPNKVYTDFEQVREEIEAETIRLTGTDKNISTEQIILKIFSATVVNLSLIDLPGITKVPVGNQPLDIENIIRDMILHFISNPQSLILAVTPANQDFANSEALKLAREVDADGDRTLCVLTKLDLMDRGTDALGVLRGEVIPVKLGIIGVVNRSQADIDSNKSIDDCLNDEIAYISTIDGSSKNIGASKLSGGARICAIFYDEFEDNIDNIESMGDLTLDEVLSSIKNASGLKPAMFIPERSFEILVKKQMKRFKEPMINCVDLVYEELVRIIQHCGKDIKQEMDRFPLLYDRIRKVLSTILSARIIKTKEYVSDYLETELAFINTKHPDFIINEDLVKAFNEDPNDENFGGF
uniref:Dynamin-type G domain-containing protein n=1 Tax=Panagrolaimus sp. ES5 TaxID=591445 RepID=A0AC34G0R9_9BILA